MQEAGPIHTLPCQLPPGTNWQMCSHLEHGCVAEGGWREEHAGGHGAAEMGTRSRGAEPEQGVRDRSLQHLPSFPPLHLSSHHCGLSLAQPLSSTSTSCTTQVCQQWDWGGVKSRS